MRLLCFAVLTGFVFVTCGEELPSMDSPPSLRDLTPPTLTFTSHTASINVVTSANIMILGRAADATLDSRGLYGVFVAKDQQTNFTQAMGLSSWSNAFTLVNGDNVVYAYVRDKAGWYSKTNSIIIRLDPNAPTLSVATPTASFITNSLTVSLAGTAGHSSGIDRVTWSRTTADITAFAQVGTTANAWTNWTGTAAVTNGTNIIRVVARSKDTSYSPVRTLTVVADTVSPEVTVTSDTQLIYTATSRAVTITGTAKDDLTGVVRVEAILYGQTNLASGTTGWNVTVTCTNQENNIHVYAIDRAGNRSAMAPVYVVLEKKMIELEATSFTRGSVSVTGASPEHSVTFGYTLVAGKYEITRADWAAYSGVAPTAGEENLPVVNVSWFDAIKYCNFLSVHHGLTRAYNETTGALLRQDGSETVDIRLVEGYRLPTEAEWEYIARDRGTKAGDLYAGGQSDPGIVAIFATNTTVAVGSKTPTLYGIYDLSGNAAEWCHDWYGLYPSTPQSQPIGAATGTLRIVRGGHFASTLAESPVYLKAAARSWLDPAGKNANTGFRLVRTVVAQ